MLYNIKIKIESVKYVFLVCNLGTVVLDCYSKDGLGTKKRIALMAILYFMKRIQN